MVIALPKSASQAACSGSVVEGYYSTIMVTARLLGGQTSGPQVLVPQVPGSLGFLSVNSKLHPLAFKHAFTKLP